MQEALGQTCGRDRFGRPHCVNHSASTPFVSRSLPSQLAEILQGTCFASICCFARAWSLSLAVLRMLQPRRFVIYVLLFRCALVVLCASSSMCSPLSPRRCPSWHVGDASLGPHRALASGRHAGCRNPLLPGLFLASQLSVVVVMCPPML